ncbi:thiamine/thiamine pyrophosphate ABC transporter permease ThiP [Yoonia sediminilitoris]|uniref:Thiamine transport system permease protein n=1 Tax=Yoonia sediminilitoris TaxID=1286148 RepID=A0A2T6KHA9_9RHOB|nr:thiamine/thiamine pyrophosphate ABC transporter permease ThiP [Yoonia sediminilitoris]PUB14851.1 thiamine transport system permease protein [Yoonia sediminilitoris]RCW95568.1 thiamine transport system permease protein [Yoonia sediminilitoris]
MAHSPFTIKLRWPGALAGALVLLLTLGTLGAVAWQAEWVGGLSPADYAAIRFTVLQALASAAISTMLAIPVARALARRQFRGRSILITLLGAPFLLPVIVAVLGLLMIFGRSGLLNGGLAWLGLPGFSIYGFHGVVMAHVFFNLPLATRLILQGWLAIPAERFRLTASLNASVWQLLERPMLRAVAPGAFLVIFLICLTSFAVALTLGGGPRATTVELAIYQALRFDFDLGRAALLAGIQFLLCACAALVVWRLSTADMLSGGMDRRVQRWDSGAAWLDMLVISAAAIFLSLPLAMIVFRGLPGLVDLPVSVWWAAARSISVALVSALLCSGMAVALALWGGRFVAVVGVLPLAASGLVIGTGAFLLIYPVMNPAKAALVVTALVNATLALPFALRALEPGIDTAKRDFDRLAASLGFGPWRFARMIILPRVRRPLGFGAGLAAALSMGDLGVIALFAGDAQETLPLAMYRLMGAYQMQSAAGAGLLLLGLSLSLFWIFDKGGRAHAQM